MISFKVQEKMQLFHYFLRMSPFVISQNGCNFNLVCSKRIFLCMLMDLEEGFTEIRMGKYYRLIFQCLLIDLRVLIGPYSKSSKMYPVKGKTW